ncbi:hypothetical protein SH2C18_19720 [Clostridium sediminicola]|uniref:sensor histidine kinase n=1 Tax=Clostridium sediminicola TaxID=3114879 RepID=UPI0031F21930
MDKNRMNQTNRLKKIFDHLKRLLFNQKISRKIALVYVLFIMSSIIFTYLLYSYVLETYSAVSQNNSSKQTLISVKTNLVEMIDTANNNYNLLLKFGIKDVLKEPMTLENRKIYDNFIFTLVDTYNNLDAIYITDFDKFFYGIDKKGRKKLSIESIKNASWYEEIIKARGRYILYYNAGNIFEKTYQSDFISAIRVINDLETQEPIGIAIFNIPIKSINELFETVFTSNNTYVGLYDQDNSLMVQSDRINATLYTKGILENIGENQLYYSEIHDDKLTAALYIPEHDWKIIAEFPVKKTKYLSDSLVTISLLVLFFNAILMLLSYLLISKSVSKPIYQLINAMRGMKNGDFETIEVKYSNSEVGILQKNYNLMVNEIQSLITKLVKEQKIKRKVELRVLQEQIKPHFLYNTLDAIGYMALAEEPQHVYEAIETLGSFYRGSLSSGGQVITVDQEIQIVKDYISLLRLRYESLFNVSYDIDEEVLNYKVLKLITQPLIENAIYHGIKPMGSLGMIRFSVKKQKDNICFMVEDNGVGMDNDTIISLKNAKLNDKNYRLGFGLIGTMERINIFYGNNAIIDINSKKHHGTVVKIIIPLV